MVRRLITTLAISCLLYFTGVGFASDQNQVTGPWSELLELKQTSSFRYQETRYLQLLDQPWQGGGLLLASKDGTLVKLQMRPQRKIMAITPGEMIYFDSETGERHRMPLSASNPMARQALIFQELLQGNPDKISADYDLVFQQKTSSWLLRLKPKPVASVIIFSEIIMRGNTNDTSRSITLNEQGGDKTVMTMHVLETGPQLEYMIERLLREATGQ